MVRSIAPRAIPFAAFMLFIAFSGPLDRLADAVGMDPRWWYGVRTIVVAALLVAYWRQYQELRTGVRGPAADWLLGLAVGVVVFVLWINLDFTPLTLGTSAGFDPRGGDGGVIWRLAAVRLAGAALVVPVMEELFWRSFLMRWVQQQRFLEVDPRRVGLVALGLTSAVFAVEHHQWFAGLLAGLGYGWLYIRTGNLWVPIVAHGTTNALLGAWILWSGSWQFW